MLTLEFCFQNNFTQKLDFLFSTKMILICDNIMLSVLQLIITSSSYFASWVVLRYFF